MIAVIGWTGPCDSSPDDVKQTLRQVIAALRKPVVKAMISSIQGQSRTCWETVANAAKTQGGKLLSGWSVLDVDPRLPQKNPFARIVLNAHAIWEKDGQWYETIPERQEAVGFIPAIVPTPNACIEFFDDKRSLKRVDLPAFSFDGEPFRHWAFEFPDVPEDASSQQANSDSANGEQTKRTSQPKFKAGRNDPCPCGSGAKFKKCCLRR
jgi:hypothetical protein